MTKTPSEMMLDVIETHRQTVETQRQARSELDALRSELERREAFVHGFVAAKDPKTAQDTLVLLPEADRAYEEWKQIRDQK